MFESDLVVVRVRGDYHLSDAEAIGAELEACLAHSGRVFVIIDQTQAGAVPLESRRYLAEWNRRHTLAGVANFGGSAPVRVVATLLMNAYRLIRPTGAHMIYSADEAGARAWVSEQRSRSAPH